MLDTDSLFDIAADLSRDAAEAAIGSLPFDSVALLQLDADSL